jgi:tetratricopeptide (TPR) repeat protein
MWKHCRIINERNHGDFQMCQHLTNLCDLCEADRFTYLAHWREEEGDYVLAAAWLQRAVALKQLAGNIDPLELANDFYNLGLLYTAMDDNFNAKRFLLKAWQHQKKHLGSRHPDTLKTISVFTKLSCTQNVLANIQAPRLLDLAENIPVPVPERRRIRDTD